MKPKKRRQSTREERKAERKEEIEREKEIERKKKRERKERMLFRMFLSPKHALHLLFAIFLLVSQENSTPWLSSLETKADPEKVKDFRASLVRHQDATFS